MSYSDHSTPPGGSPPFRHVKPAPNTPAAGKLTSVMQVAAVIWGPEVARHAMHYGANLGNALKLMAHINETGADPAGSWLHLREEIKSCAASLLGAADVVTSLAMLKSGLINPGLLNNVPPALMARIVARGLECESEDLLNLIETVPGAEGGPEA